MKNKGFVLMETIVVIVVISVALLTIFSSYNKILSKVKSENKYDTSEYIYMTYYIKENLNSICSIGTINAESINNSNLTNYVNAISCTGRSKFSLLNVEKIYVLTDLETMGTNGNKFDAYMIDYIRKLDVNNSDKLIIVEYKRPAYDINFTQKRKNSSFITEAEKPMYETYIASLEW